MSDTKENISVVSDIQKEWDEISCPICLDHPHNAVLLICTSYKNGCRSYICDTSSLHSNCLDRFKNLQLSQSDNNDNNSEAEKMKCPLCRGTVTSWEVVDEPRQYWNAKKRSCSEESCEFYGNYGEIVEHARRDHPTSRPCDVDPVRQRAWRQLEQASDFGDLLSVLRAAMPVQDNEADRDDRDVLARLNDDSSPRWWATLFLYHVLSWPSESRARPRRRRRRSSRYLWGESLLGPRQSGDDNDDEEDDSDDDYAPGGDGVRRPRRRRRTRSRDDEELSNSGI